jgi:ADP-ribose pyrophosphatase YjhB (NUDIX family)
VLLLDEHDRVLLFRGQRPGSGEAFWFPTGGGMEDGEDVTAAARREVAEETGLTELALGPEVWRRRHVFTWRGEELDQRERWFVARVAHFEPTVSGWTDVEKEDLTASRWWSVDELEATGDDLVPRRLAELLGDLLRDGPPDRPVEISV